MFTTRIMIGLAMVAGLLLTRVMKLFNLPNVTGYLIAGLLIGVGSLGGQVMDGPVDIGVLLKGEALPQGCYRLRTLGRGGIVQIHQGLPVHSTGKGGKLTANLCEGHSHWISLQIYINLRYD